MLLTDFLALAHSAGISVACAKVIANRISRMILAIAIFVERKFKKKMVLGSEVLMSILPFNDGHRYYK